MLVKIPLTKIRISYFLFIALLITAAASARQNAAQMPPQAQQNSTPTQVHSNKMYLDVVVSQKSGPPVAGLEQQDFTLLDNKSPQAITSFKEIAGRQAPINVVLVIDAVNVDARTITYEREQIEKFLSSEGGQLAFPTVLSVFTETGIQISGDFTNDGDALRTQLDSDKIGLRPVGRAAGFYGATERLHLSLTALRQFTARENAHPGRNVMIWISPGWPILSGPNVELDSKQKLSSSMQPIAFAMELPGHTERPGAKINFSCTFESTRIACVVDGFRKYQLSHFSLNQTLPYVFMPVPDASPLDFAWFMQMELSQAERAVGRITAIPLISFQETPSGEDPKLAAIETERVKYLGQEQAEVVSQKILAHKFQEVVDPPEDPDGPGVYWLSSSGLLLQVAGSSGVSLVLSDYHGPLLGNN